MTWFHQQSYSSTILWMLYTYSRAYRGATGAHGTRKRYSPQGSPWVIEWMPLKRTVWNFLFLIIGNENQVLMHSQKTLHYWVTSTTQIKQIEIKLTVKELFLKSIFWNQRIHCCRPLWEIKRKKIETNSL